MLAEIIWHSVRYYLFVFKAISVPTQIVNKTCLLLYIQFSWSGKCTARLRSWIIHLNLNKFVAAYNDINILLPVRCIHGHTINNTVSMGLQKRRKLFIMTQMYCCSLWKLNHVCARESNRKWCASLSRSSLQTFHFWIFKIWRDNIIIRFISLRKKLTSSFSFFFLF